MNDPTPQQTVNRVVVGVDGSAHGWSALRAACRRATGSRSSVLGVVGTEPLTATVLPPVPGTGGFPGTFVPPVVPSQSASTDVDTTLARIRVEFMEICHEHGIDGILQETSEPMAEALIRNSLAADLTVIGTRTGFNASVTARARDATVRELMREGGGPLLVIPAEHEESLDVVIFYDGTPAAARAVRAFIHTDPNSEYRLHLLCGADAEREAMEIVDPMLRYLRAHGYEATCGIHIDNAKADLLAVAKQRQPATVVMGPSSRGRFTGYLMSSLTMAAIDDGTLPLFIGV